MRELGRHLWVRVRHGVETLAGMGAAVWQEPALCRKALGELLGVLPATHVQIDLDGVLAGAPGETWGALLRREGRWDALLTEQALAIGSALRAPATWGLGLPSVGAVAAAAGDTSERGTIKAGMLLASALQAFRSSSLTFVTVAVPRSEAGADRARGPTLKNSELYGWTRAAMVPDLGAAAAPVAGTNVTLVEAATTADLLAPWSRGERVGGGLGPAVWSGTGPAEPAPARFLLFGEIPPGTTAKAIVEGGRALRTWMGA